MANPLPHKKSKEREIVEPAEKGMEYIIEAATLNKVKRILVTSSGMSIVGSFWKHSQPGMNNEEIEYSEEDFAPIGQCKDPYDKSK